jgi:hypothetical protein
VFDHGRTIFDRTGGQGDVTRYNDICWTSPIRNPHICYICALVYDDSCYQWVFHRSDPAITDHKNREFVSRCNALNLGFYGAGIGIYIYGGHGTASVSLPNHTTVKRKEKPRFLNYPLGRASKLDENIY